MDTEASSTPLSQGHDESLDRRLAVAWRDNSERPSIWPIGVLDFVDRLYRFEYVKAADTIAGFRPILEFPRFGEGYVSEELFSFFGQRVMDKARPDYLDYLEALALPSDATDLDVLGRSGGRRKADNVQVIEIPRADPDGSTTFTFLVHGIRYSPAGDGAVTDALAKLQAGDALTLVPQTDNPVNPKALLVVTQNGIEIGWVPDLLVDYFALIRAAGDYTLGIVRVNGPEVASQARLVARIVGHVPSGREPFDGSEWDT